MTANWYALQTKAQKEALVAQQLESHEVEVFYPQLHIKPVNPRSRTVRPFFPCYIFVEADLEQVGSSFFQHLPHAIGLVRCGDDPAMVDKALLQEIYRRLEQINTAGGETFFHLKHGDRVIIEHGPFAGYEAIFDTRLRDSDRVHVLLELLGQRPVLLNLEVGHIRSKER